MPCRKKPLPHYNLQLLTRCVSVHCRRGTPLTAHKKTGRNCSGRSVPAVCRGCRC